MTYFIQTVCVCVLVCMYVFVCVCVCVHVFSCMYVTNVCKNISIISISSSLQNENSMCVYDCVRACVHVCVCAWQLVAHICLIALAAKGLKT